jgi:hypothetical protein
MNLNRKFDNNLKTFMAKLLISLLVAIVAVQGLQIS